MPGRTHGLGLITKHLLADFPTLSQQSFASINLWATLIGALFCLPCGWLLDRLGIRIVLTCVMGSLAAVVLWMASIRDVPTLIVAITLTRGIGQSMLSVVSISMVGKWFQRHQGVAMGVYTVLMSALMGPGTKMLSSYINTPGVGWRGGWWLIGIILAIATPICALLAANPRRAPDTPTPETKELPPAEPSATLGQALATPCFWVFALAISFFGLVSSGVSLWQQLILEERHLDAAVFGNVLMIGFVVGTLASLACGGLAQVLRLSHLLAAAMLLLGSAYVLLPLARTPAQAYAFAVVQGLGGGMLTVLFFAVWRHAFGSAHLGRIQGAAQMLTVLASAVGPLLVARSQFQSGSYNQILWTFAGVSAAFACVAAITPVPNARAGAWRETGAADAAALPRESLA